MDTLKDKALEELFQAQKPHFTDNAAFMNKLNRRLDAVEFVRRQQEATLRRYKIAMLVAFIAGILCGGITIGLVLSVPAEVPLFTFQVQTGFLLWLGEHSRLISASALSLLMSVGILCVIGNVQDILQMRGQLRTS